MNALGNQLCAVVSAAVDEFIEELATKFKLDKNEIKELWNEQADEKVKIVETKKVIKKTTTEEKRTCIYEFRKKHLLGTLCGSRVCAESKNGTHCKKHLAYENKVDAPKKEKKAPAVVKKAPGTKKAESKELEIKVIKSLQERTSPMISVQMNDWKQYVHEGTDLVFDHKKREVIGRADGKGGIIPLTTDDISIAIAEGFKYQTPNNLTSTTEIAEEDEDEEVRSDIEEDYEEEEEED